MRIEAKGWTDIGLTREINEDSFDVSFQGKECLCLLADGMGGGPRGEIASQLAVRGIKKFIQTTPKEEELTLELEDFILKRIEAAILKINKMLYHKTSENQNLAGMGTTIVAAYCDNKRLYLAHVGDSRCYLIRSGEIMRLTKDHSYVQELYDKGIIAEDQIDSHPKKNIITRALGVEAEVKSDSKSLTVQDKDIFLLCSDGLTGKVKDREIKEIIEIYRDDLDTAARVLIDLVNKRGGDDNTTFILLKITEDRRFALIASWLTRNPALFVLLTMVVGLIGGGIASYARFAFAPYLQEKVIPLSAYHKEPEEAKSISDTSVTGFVGAGPRASPDMGAAKSISDTSVIGLAKEIAVRDKEAEGQKAEPAGIELTTDQQISGTPPQQAPQIQRAALKEKPKAVETTPKIVAEQTQAPLKTKKEPVTERKGKFVIQAGAFTSEKEAWQRVAFLRSRYLKEETDIVYLAGPVKVKGQNWYRVLLGPFPNKANANRLLQQIETQDRAEAFVREMSPADR
ncbi:MAG: Stp1/IreP family PP2C-type Ser/Thr phosphatase [bacterium]